MELQDRIARIVTLPTRGTREGQMGKVSVNNFDKVVALYLLTREHDGSILDSQTEIAHALHASQSRVSSAIEHLWISEIINTGVYISSPTPKGYDKVIQFRPEYGGPGQ